MKLWTPFVCPTIEDETPADIAKRKELFAELLLKEPAEPFKVALIVYPDNTSRALRIAREWPQDEEVKALQKSIVDAEGEMPFLPTKAEAARLAYSIANNDRLITEDRLNALKLYCSVRGFIEKPAAAVVNNNVVTNRVMVVRDYGTDDQWEQKAIAQQARLRREALVDVSAT